MLHFLGNCQMDFLSRAVADHGAEVCYTVQASPLTFTSSPGVIPPELATLSKEMDLGVFFRDRLLANQYGVLPEDAPAPQLFILNLFHEQTPLFIHKADQYIFFMDPAAWQDNPVLETWIKTNCGMIQPNPKTYLKRMGEMVMHLRALHPGTPILVASRLTHYPAFGPSPYSYVKGWTDLGLEAQAHLKVWERQIDNVHILDMDRVFGGIWRESDTSIENHCPFLKITLEEKDGQITGLHARRDVEHISSMWPRLADKVRAFLETGRIEYTEDETVPRAWNRGWQPAKLAPETMLSKLSSGANYACAEAVGAFYLDLATDYTPLLGQTGHLTPVCHNTLHMIRHYGRIFRNPRLAQWCDAHEKTAREFTANGPLYRADYLRRIAEIRDHALS